MAAEADIAADAEPPLADAENLMATDAEVAAEAVDGCRDGSRGKDGSKCSRG